GRADVLELAAEVLEQVAGNLVVGDGDALAPVALEVGNGNAQPLAGDVLAASVPELGDVPEPASALVMVENAFLGLVEARAAGAHVAAVVTQLRVCLRPKLNIVADVEVEPAIAIHIGKAGGGAPALRRNAGLLAHIPKAFAVLVMQQQTASVGRDVDVIIAVVIIVAHRAAQEVTGELLQPDSRRHV